MAAVDVNEWFEIAEKLVRDGGQLVRKAHKEKKDVEIKTNPGDVVTKTDKAVEDLLISGLTNSFPDHKFIGEESVAAGQKCNLTDAPTWIIDPVDGTMNFVHGLPFFCVSLGLFVNKEAVLGLIYNPIHDQFWSAKKGKGAFLNGEKIAVTGTKELNKSLIYMEIYNHHKKDMNETVLTNVSTLMPKVHGIRAMGSGTLGILSIASGWGDAYFHFGLHCWDTAAASLVLTEAGGVMCDTTGGTFDLMNGRVMCAASSELAQEVAKNLKQYETLRDD